MPLASDARAKPRCAGGTTLVDLDGSAISDCRQLSHRHHFARSSRTPEVAWYPHRFAWQGTAIRPTTAGHFRSLRVDGGHPASPVYWIVPQASAIDFFSQPLGLLLGGLAH